MNNCLKKWILGICFLVLPAMSAKAPRHKTLRALSMGDAFVAVAEDKDAVYYNPAGLNLMNKLGNYDKYPELGYYPDNWLDMRMGLGASAPLAEALDIYNLATDFSEIIERGMVESGDDQNVLLDTLANHQNLMDEVYRYDAKPVFLGSKFDAEMAFHNFGGAIWVDGGIAPYIDGGIITPSAGLDTVYVDAVAQAAGAYGITPKWSVGLGYKAAWRQYVRQLEVSLLEWEEAQGEVNDEVDRVVSNVSSLNEVMDAVGHAVEMGVMYQWKREVRLGASLRDVYITDLGDESVSPNFTFGIAWSPRKFQRNTAYARKINFAADFADAFNADKNYKFFSHINFGAEWEQVLLAIPSLTFGSNARALKGRLAAGFKGGYFTFGGGLELLRIFHVDFATWADEGGYFTGQREERYYQGQVSIGF